MNFFKQIASNFNKPKVDFSKFDMSHEHKTSMRIGELVPILCEEVLPGDKWHINANAFVRTMPLLSPMMHKVDLKMRFFFVPNRLVWDDWERFISDGTKNGKEIFIPTLDIATNPDPKATERISKWVGKGSLLNYFGFSVPTGKKRVISQLPFRAYDLIWQEYFCNQAVSPKNIERGYDGPKWFNKFGDHLELGHPDVSLETVDDLMLPESVCFEPDYFTSCLPTPISSTPGVLSWNGSVHLGRQQAVQDSLYKDANTNVGTLQTVSDLRNAMKLQHFLENSMRTGKRYIEQLMAHFGVESSDARLQRPEYLGGGQLAVQISEVASTAEGKDIQLGDLAGRGLSVGSFGDINFTSEEHGFIFGLAYIVPHTSYFGGIPRTFMRHERLDYAFPEFATLGEQPVFQQELDAFAEDNVIFGYVPRYSEYKQSLDKFSGEMTDTLAHWHLGRNLFKSAATLNDKFVYVTDAARKEFNRIFGVTKSEEHPFICSFGFNSSAIRPLPFNPQTIL